MPVTSYSTTPGSNTSAAPNGAPEGWAPSAVNDTIRQIMTDIAVEAQVNAVKVLASVAGTNTVTGSMTPDLTAYSAGMLVVLTPAGVNTTAATLNIDSLGALDILKGQGDAIVAGDLITGVPAYLLLDSGADDFYLLNPQSVTLPQNAQTGNYTTVVGDVGKHIYHASAAGAGDTYTIPANATVAYPLGTVLTFINSDSNAVSIAITTDTMTLAGTTTTGTRTLAQNGIATAVKVTSTSWLISGSGLS